MTRRGSRIELAWLALVLAGLALAYLPGLGNGLVFDDSYLTEGLFTDYGSLAHLRPRLFSYGSFVWLHALFGDGWWKQRLVNLLLHAGVVAALWGFYREILRHVAPAAAAPGEEPVPYDRSPALPLSIAFFALNPVAVYAVAYLIQRSIVLATLFVVVGLWLFARGLAERKPWMHVLALACYGLAVASKEHAILAPLAALPVYIVVARPTGRRLAAVGIVGAVLVAIAGAALYGRYGRILGKPFDEYSRVYLAQLASLDPAAPAHAYGLSILNESWLFFRYGLAWLVPWSGWMSIDLRPPFPLGWLAFPQLLGALGYVAVVIGGFWLVLRHRDWRALAGLSLLMPALLFATEFATVWVQDPFVLYRSYLWAIGIPGTVFMIFHGPSFRVLFAIGAALGALLVWQALDRVLSLENAETAWTDAIAKLPNDPRSVGRWFPYLNRGSAYADADSFELALRDFEASSSLGDLGMGQFNMGSILAAKGKPREALAAFDRAAAQGYTGYNLPFQRGLALAALGRRDEALRDFRETVRERPPSPTREAALLALGRAAIEANKPDEAVRALEELAQIQPANREARYLLGMAYVAKGEAARARQVFDKLLFEQANPRLFYARAVANFKLNDKAGALADIENAIRLSGDDPNLRAWRERILRMP